MKNPLLMKTEEHMKSDLIGNEKIGDRMNRSMAEDMVIRLLSSSAGLSFGRVVASVRIHEGRVTKIIFSTTEHKKELKKI